MACKNFSWSFSWKHHFTQSAFNIVNTLIYTQKYNDYELSSLIFFYQDSYCAFMCQLWLRNKGGVQNRRLALIKSAKVFPLKPLGAEVLWFGIDAVVPAVLMIAMFQMTTRQFREDYIKITDRCHKNLPHLTSTCSFFLLKACLSSLPIILIEKKPRNPNNFMWN